MTLLIRPAWAPVPSEAVGGNPGASYLPRQTVRGVSDSIKCSLKSFQINNVFPQIICSQKAAPRHEKQKEWQRAVEFSEQQQQKMYVVDVEKGEPFETNGGRAPGRCCSGHGSGASEKHIVRINVHVVSGGSLHTGPPGADCHNPRWDRPRPRDSHTRGRERGQVQPLTGPCKLALPPKLGGLEKIKAKESVRKR